MSIKTDRITKEFIEANSADCSYISVRWWQVLWYAAIGAGVLGALAYRWDILLCIVNLVFAFWYFSVILFKTVVTSLSAFGIGQTKVSSQDLATLKEEDLPIYTILVPLYKEANIAGKIIHSMNSIDYPKEKLDIKLLLEEDDEQTISAVRNINLTDNYDVVIVPQGQPKTKPRACNYGLERSRGKYCVIYDAEDRPDPDQLRKVVYLFEKLSGKVACIQAKLNYFNARQNLLTRWFTIEYSTTFDLYLPGLQCLNVPIPLGGTSNHFRTDILRELKGWDPFNVTEDCDLGIRIYKRGYKTRLVDSTTWEEANPQVWNWIRQRSRWVKGFFQTHLTHMRNPFRTLWQLNPWGFFGFLMSVGGSSVMMLLNIVYWLVGGGYLVLMLHASLSGHSIWEILKGPRDPLTENFIWPMIYYGPKQDPIWSTLSVAFFFITIGLLAANLLFVFMHCLACVKRRFFFLIPAALAMPLYWILISIGAWKGFLQLFTNPFYWEKTIHGLDAPGVEDLSVKLTSQSAGHAKETQARAAEVDSPEPPAIQTQPGPTPNIPDPGVQDVAPLVDRTDDDKGLPTTPGQ